MLSGEWSQVNSMYVEGEVSISSTRISFVGFAASFSYFIYEGFKIGCLQHNNPLLSPTFAM